MKICIQIRRNERGQYRAFCPSLPGCVSSGQTEQQAKQRLEEAIQGYIASVSNFVPTDIRELVEYES